MTTLATVITGASSGIGEALARQLAQSEKNVLVLVARRTEKLQTLAAELTTAQGLRVESLALDLEKPGASAELLQAIARMGLEVDTLINNAGFGVNGLLADTPLQRVQGMMQLNMVALTELCHGVLPGMRSRRHGRIMNMASIAAFQPCPHFAVYAATKSYVLSMSEALAIEERKNGITVIAVCPGSTRTEFHDVAGNHGTLVVKFMDTAESVAKTAIRSMQCGRSMVVTGLQNKPVPLLNRLLPRSVMTWLADKTVSH